MQDLGLKSTSRHYKTIKVNINNFKFCLYCDLFENFLTLATQSEKWINDPAIPKSCSTKPPQICNVTGPTCPLTELDNPQFVTYLANCRLICRS